MACRQYSAVRIMSIELVELVRIPSWLHASKGHAWMLLQCRHGAQASGRAAAGSLGRHGGAIAWGLAAAVLHLVLPLLFLGAAAVQRDAVVQSWQSRGPAGAAAATHKVTACACALDMPLQQQPGICVTMQQVQATAADM